MITHWRNPMSTETMTRRNETHAERMNPRHTVAPRVDIFENADTFLILVDLPGVPRDRLQIDLDNGQLVLSAERSVAPTGNATSSEFAPRAYHRAFTLPRGIDTEKVGAELKNGVLTLSLPKSASVKPRRIDVRTS
jgi:HSP20 family molecular chaperone IbpA